MNNCATPACSFPIDPGADASIGGMTATRASGTNAVRYGTMKDNVLSLVAVTADGSIVRTASRAKKSSAGYDLTRLFVGSEGTLGIVTEITLRLHGIPEAMAAGHCPFKDVRSACDATIATIQSGLPVARIELLDALQVRACNNYSKLSLPETPMLFVEFHGTSSGVAEQSQRFGEIAAEFGGGPFAWATRPEERTRLWQARHDVYWASLTLRPGARPFATDVCVPISRLADCVEETQRDIAEAGLVAPIVGHVGDGNFHVSPLVDMDDPADIARAEAFSSRLVRRALAMDGTCTGEHGVGQKKIQYVEEEYSARDARSDAARQTSLRPCQSVQPGQNIATIGPVDEPERRAGSRAIPPCHFRAMNWDIVPPADPASNHGLTVNLAHRPYCRRSPADFGADRGADRALLCRLEPATRGGRGAIVSHPPRARRREGRDRSQASPQPLHHFESGRNFRSRRRAAFCSPATRWSWRLA